MGHMAALELPSQEGRALSCGTHGSTGAPLSERQSSEPWDTWQHQSSPCQGGKVQSRGTRGSAGAHLSKEARSGAVGHVVALDPTSVGRCGSKLQLTWQHVNARHPPCLDLELICGGTPPSGYRRRPPGPPRERLRTRRWGQLFGAPLGYLKLFTWQSMAGPRQVPELEVRERPPSTLRNVDDGPLGGAGAGDPGASHHQC
jgi:hypothetical protein